MLNAHTALTLEVIEAPHVVVSGVKDNLNSPIRQLRQAAQDPYKAARCNLVVLEPEVEDIAQEVDGLGILGNHIEPAAEGTLGALRLLAIGTAEVYVRHEVYHSK